MYKKKRKGHVKPSRTLLKCTAIYDSLRKSKQKDHNDANINWSADEDSDWRSLTFEPVWHSNVFELYCFLNFFELSRTS